MALWVVYNEQCHTGTGCVEYSDGHAVLSEFFGFHRRK